MPADYHHGVRTVQVAEGTRPIRMINTGVIGIVGTAPDADAAKFPLNTPVLLSGQRAQAAGLDTAGNQNGTLPKAMDAIYDQIAPFIIVVRVEEGVDDAETTSNIIGGTDAEGNLTGMQALLASKSMFGFKPRILGVPGLDNDAVTAELIGIADKLRGFVYASAFGATTKEDAITYRDNFGSKRLMILWPKFRGWDTVANDYADVEAVSRALGLRAKIDSDIGWHKTISNIPVAGVTGINKQVFFDISNDASDATYLNSNEVTTLIKDNGFRFWGSRTCSADPKLAFESAVRTSDVLADSIDEAMMWAIDKPMTKTLIKDIVESCNAKFRELKALGYIVDAGAYIDPEKNTVESLEAGKLYVDYDFSPVPPLENLMFTQVITNEYLVQLTDL